MVLAIGLFAFLVMKEVSLPSTVILAFGGLALLGLFMIGLQNPEVPLYALIAYLPFSRTLVGDFGTQVTALNMTNILVGWVLIGYLVKQASRRSPLLEGAILNKLILLFCALGTVSLIRASSLYGSWYFWELIIPLKRWLMPFFLYFITLWVVRDKRVLKTVAILIMAGTFVVALMAIRDYSFAPNASFEDSRVGGIAEQPNMLGAFFVYYMFLFLGFFLTAPGKPKRWFLLIPFLVCFRGIMVTFSRGAYLGFAAGGLAAAFFRNKLLFLAALGGLVLVLINPVYLPAGIQYRMGMTIEQKHAGLVDVGVEQNLESSAATRIIIWRGAAQMIKENPWWGVGYGAFPRFLPHYTEGRVGTMDAHNSYLLIAAEMGIPTLIVFLLILMTVIYYTRWLYLRTGDPFLKALALGFLAGLIGLVVTNFFGSRIDSQETAGFFWILCGLIMRAVLMERRGKGRETGGKGELVPREIPKGAWD